MARLALLNIAMGFFLLFLATIAGIFNAFELTTAYLNDNSALGSWLMVLSQSSHGHTALFGVVEILVGLTMSYSRFPKSIKILQSIGLLLGSFAMGPLLLTRAYLGPSASISPLGAIIGLCLCCFTLSLLSHSAAIWLRTLERGYK